MNYDELYQRLAYGCPVFRLQMMGWAVCHQPRPELPGHWRGIPIRLCDVVAEV